MVEPAYKTKYPPLGLMKISTYHKRQGDTVHYVKDIKRNKQLDLFRDSLRLSPDLIYITSLFTYHIDKVISSINHYKTLYPNAEIKVGGIAATLMPEYINQRTGIIPHIGLLDYAEDCPPDYSLPPAKAKDYSITFTSRGCPNNCSFCLVSKHEPDFVTKEWRNDIDLTKPKIYFLDNNWLASPNLEKDVETLVDLLAPHRITGKLASGVRGVRRYIDFTQGLDCRLVNKDNVKLLEQLKIYPIRFAYDNPSHEGYIQDAIRLTRGCVYKATMVYTLYNTDYSYDTPEYLYYRLNELNKLGVRAYPMRYAPLDCLDRKYIGKHWDKDLLRGVQITVGFLHLHGYGTIRPNRDFFLAYTDNANDFVNKMYRLVENEKKEKKNYPKRECHEIRTDKSIGKDKCLTEAQIKELIKVSTEKTGLLIEFLYLTACRVSELINIRLSHCKINKHVKIRILGKGKKERFVYITNDLYKRINEVYNGKNYLFESKSGKKLNRVNVTKQIKKVGRRLGLDISSHTFRHSKAIDLLINKGYSIQVASKFLGHSTPTTTSDMYIHRRW